MLRNELGKHLSLLERQGVITAWHDRDIAAGSDWADQIDQHLETAKVILLLISADFLASNYCYDIELSRAIERHELGEACVIPILLRDVDWGGAPFSKLQALPKNAEPVMNWANRDQAFADVTKGIRRAVEQLKKARLSKPARSTDEPIPPAELEYPEGQVPLESSFYVERNPIESDCYEVVLKPGSLLRIKAPKLMGKTSLMTRTLHHAASLGYATVHLNLGEVEGAVLTDMNKFLRWFCWRVGKQLNLENRSDDYWDAELMSSNSNCTDYFEGYLLSELDRPLVLGLDEVDQIFPCANTAANFFRMLRNWHEKGKNQDIWKHLRLVISHSTEAYIRLHTNSSPFNVGVPIQLPEFTPEQVENLARSHGLNWDQTEVEQLMALVGGHPYLVRLGMYKIARQEVTLNQLIQDPPTDEGIYGNHLRRHWDNLQQNPELAEAIKRIMTAQNPVKVERMQGHKLHSMGLIEWQGTHVVPSCDLYRQYFSR